MTIPFSQLEGIHLAAGAVYEGGSNGNISDDPLARLLKGGNSGGFRYCGSVESLNYLIIT
ncbi:MAG TPA: restriction endonuclease, partial [Desulfobacteraceae bacterium]|nr:restriction endonuclease [Desulfobacteraceae bacterium]